MLIPVFQKKHPNGAIKRKERESYPYEVAVSTQQKKMHLTQCSVLSSKGSSKNITSECYPNRAPQWKRTKYLENKSTSEERDSYDDMV